MALLTDHGSSPFSAFVSTARLQHAAVLSTACAVSMQIVKGLPLDNQWATEGDACDEIRLQPHDLQAMWSDLMLSKAERMNKVRLASWPPLAGRQLDCDTVAVTGQCHGW